MLETFDWQWRNGGVARRAPRVRPAAERVLPAPDLRLLLVRGAVARSTPSRSTPTTSSSRPTTRTRRASTPGRARRRSARATTRPACSATCPTTCWRKVLHDNAAAVYGLRDATAEPRRSRPRVAAPRRRASRGRVLHLRIDRVERRNAFTQDMYRGHQAGRGLGRRAARARRGVPHRHRRAGSVPAATWPGQAERPRGPRRGVGPDRPVPVPPHRALLEALGGARSTASATPAGSCSPCTAT